MNVKKYIIILAIGFILLALDIHIYTPLSYSKQYNNSNQVIGEFQYYTIASTYGARCTYKMIDADKSNTSGADSLPDNKQITGITGETQNSSATSKSIKVIDKIFFKNIRIDISSDLLGFILIAFACLKLIPAGRRFSFAVVAAVCGIILNIIIFILPFLFNGLLLCNIVLVVGLFYLASILLTTFLFASGLLGMCRDVCCRDERKWCKTSWFVAFTLQILVTFIFWIGSDFKMLYTLGYFFEAILVLDIILFWNILFRTIDYIQAYYTKALQKRVK